MRQGNSGLPSMITHRVSKINLITMYLSQSWPITNPGIILCHLSVLVGCVMINCQTCCTEYFTAVVVLYCLTRSDRPNMGVRSGPIGLSRRVRRSAAEA